MVIFSPGTPYYASIIISNQLERAFVRLILKKMIALY